MQITDINDMISTAAQLLNAPDLILIAVLLANVWLGARRGLVGALYGVLGRIGMIAASVAAAKYTAPYIAQWVVVPAVGQLFEKQAALKTAEGVLDGLRQNVTEAAVGMSESIAFSMLVVLFSVLFGRLIWIFGRSLKLIVRRTPLSALDSAGGALIGFVTGVAFVCILLIVLLINSTYGRAFKAIRDDEIAAEAMGINLARHKMISFVVSSFFCGVAGAMLAMCNTSVSSVSFTTSMTYQILLVVVVGGIGSVSGSVIAAFIYYASSEWWLRFLDLETYTASGARVPLLGYGFRMVVFSVLIMIVVLFFRKGIMGTREVSVYDDIRKIGRFFTRKSAAKGGDAQ